MPPFADKPNDPFDKSSDVELTVRFELAVKTVARQRRQLDIQSRRLTELAIAEKQQQILFERALSTAKIGMWQCDLNTDEVVWSEGVYDMFEVSRTTPLTRDLALARYTPASRVEMETVRAIAIANRGDFSLDVELIRKSGEHRWVRVTGTVEIHNGEPSRIVGMKQDITEEKLLADRNRYLAAFDVMTGLANRSQFQDRLAEIDSMTFHRHGALMLIDLDGFKQVNDTFGHALGDECLKVSAQRMNSVGSSASLLARIGGDEFAMLFSAKLTREQIEEVAKSVVSAFTHPIMLHGKTLNVGASVGIAYYSGGTSDDLFRQADTALYAAKGAGRGTYRIFSLELI